MPMTGITMPSAFKQLLSTLNEELAATLPFKLGQIAENC